jgi:hypothetical protein
LVLTDFFADMVVNVTLAETTATVGSVPAQFPPQIGDNAGVQNATRQESTTNNIALNTFAEYTYEYVDISGNVLTLGATDASLLSGTGTRNFVRYAEYPGQRLFRKVKFEYNRLSDPKGFR